MPFNKRTAKAAARKRWKANSQPTYPMQPLPKVAESDTVDIAAELPITIDALAGGAPRWEDLVFDLDPEAYRKMRVCVAIFKAVRKLAVRTAKLNWTIVGKGERADAIKEIFGQIKNWGDFIEWMTWALIEGVRFYQIKTAEARPGSKQPWKVPDFFMGGRLKKNAGGDMVWMGGKELRCEQRVSSLTTEEAKSLPDQFVIHRPGGGSNPEGDLWLGAALFNSVGKAHPRTITSGDLYMRLFGIPAIMAGAKLDNARPDRIQAMLEAKAAKALTAFDNQGKARASGLTNEETIKLLQADASGLDGIVSWARYLESIADDLLAFGVLTSSSGISDAKRTGDTQEHGEEGDDAAFANGVQIAETFNRYVMPWILRKNPMLPELKEAPESEDGEESEEMMSEEAMNAKPFQFKPKGEPKPVVAGTLEPKEPEAEMEPYLWPKDPDESDAQDVEVEAEGEDGMEGMDGMPPMDEKKPADMAMLALRQIVQLQKKKDGTVKLAAGEHALTPPVHPNCRCFIGADDVWYDAQDARVCPVCMMLGASWNLRLDIPMQPGEIEELLDRDQLEEVREAIAKDSTVTSRIIQQAGEKLESGILKYVVPVAGEPMHVTVEREIVKARAAARAGAQIVPGGFLRGIGTIPDGIVFETTPVGKRATFVSVNVATGGGYRVLWRAGKYVLQTKGGRTLESSNDLWWLLLLLALLEKKRRDEEERRKAAETAASQA